MVTDMTYTLDSRLKRAMQLREEGYNCSQCVAMVFDDVHGVDYDAIASLTAALGGGLGGLQLTCGAVAAMSMVKGATVYGSPEDKAKAYASVRPLCEEFERRNGSLICRDLKVKHKRPCNGLIADAITLLHEELKQSAG